MTDQTLNPSVEKQLQEIMELLREVLGADLVAAYRYGSCVLGGLQPRSDVDVMGLSRRHTTPVEKRRLIAGLLELSGPDAPGLPRPLELTIVVTTTRRPWTDAPNFDFQYGEWLRRRFESGELEPRDEGAVEDMASLVRIVMQASRPLFGPPAGELLDHVPREDYIRGMLACIPSLLAELEGDARNVVLTLARIWNTIATDELRSKDGAADWVLPLLPDEHRLVLAHARAAYLGEEEDHWDDVRAASQACANYMAAAIRRLRDASAQV